MVDQGKSRSAAGQLAQKRGFPCVETQQARIEPTKCVRTVCVFM